MPKKTAPKKVTKPTKETKPAVVKEYVAEITVPATPQPAPATLAQFDASGRRITR